jgi:CHAT domain-containing protein
MTRRSTVWLLALLLATGMASAASLQERLDQGKQLVEGRSYPRALAVLRPLVAEAEAAGDSAVLERALFYSARSHYFLSEYRAALTLFKRALELDRDAANRSLEAEVLRGICRLHKQQGTYPDGLRTCAEAIAIYDSLPEPREAAGAWMTVGAIRDLTGEYGAALAAYERARVGLQGIKDADYYTLFNEIGITYTNLGRYEDALAAHQASLEGRLRLGNPYHIGLSHSNLGDAYFALGQYPRAIEHYEECVRLCGAAGDRRSVAVALGQMAQAWMDAGDPRRALEYAERELEMTRAIGAGHLEGVALRHQGDAHALLGDLDAALQVQQQALALSRSSGALYDEAATLNSIAVLNLKKGEPKLAASRAERALAIAREIRAPELEWRTRVVLARSARASGNSAEATAQLRASIAIIDSVRGRVHTDSGKIGYLDTRQSVYQELAAILHDTGQAAQALEVAEAARGRAFSDLLAAQTPQLKPAAAASLAAIREAEARLRAEELRDSAEAAARARLAQTRAASEAQLSGKLRALRNEQPELASLVTAEPLEAAQIAAIAARLEATFIEYLVTEDRLLIWAVQPAGDIAGAAVNVGRSALREKVRALHGSLNNVSAADLREPRAARSQLADLHRLLLQPIERQLPRDASQRLYVVPHDALFLVPFGALIDEHGRYAIERHTLVSTPAVAMLNYTAVKRRQSVDAANAHLLALADPTPPQDAAFDALPGARTEVERLARRLPAEQRVALTGDRASEASARRLSPGQDLVHFAVHGLIRDDRPWESALVLAPGDGEDGWLKVPEIFGLELRADLVTLSGCSTGLGQLSGDGFVGLSRALIYAGTPSVAVSLWDVSDLSTAYLMDRFYAGLFAGHGKARSLRDAQLASLERYPHPALWAAFTLLGEP